MVKKIGIMGGTFDPIHIGHLVIAQAALVEGNLEKVLFIPVGNPPHKISDKITPSRDRVEMIKLGIHDNPYFELDEREIVRRGTTYTIDTLRDLKKVYDKNQYELVFIIGGDTLMEIKTWKNSKEVLQLCSFLVYQRGGFEHNEINIEANRLRMETGVSIEFVDGPTIGISSSLIRDMVMSRKSIKYLVPHPVEEYIIEKKIYIGANDNMEGKYV